MVLALMPDMVWRRAQNRVYNAVERRTAAAAAAAAAERQSRRHLTVVTSAGDPIDIPCCMERRTRTCMRASLKRMCVCVRQVGKRGRPGDGAAVWVPESLPPSLPTREASVGRAWRPRGGPDRCRCCALGTDPSRCCSLSAWRAVQHGTSARQTGAAG
eukprot:ctg_476.g266